jgi:hypothetical protein
MSLIRSRQSLSTLVGLTVVLGIAPAAVAQSSPEHQSTLRIGLLGGASLATVVHGADNLRLTYRDGIAGGAMIAIPITETLALQAEGLFAQKGAYSNFSAANVTFAQDYVEFPLLLRWDAPGFRRLTPFVLAGPALSVLTRCSVDIGSGPVPGVRSCGAYHGRDDYYYRFDYGLLGGAGLAVHIGRETFAVGARYEWGLRALGPDAVGRRRDLTYLAALEWGVR